MITLATEVHLGPQTEPETDLLQAGEVIGMFLHCTKYSSLVAHPDQVETKLMNALVRAHQMQRPVHLSIPIDVLRSPTRYRALSYDMPSLFTKPSLVDDLTVRTLFEEIKCVHQIVFIVGGGCAEAIEVIMQLVGLTGALFVSAPDGKGLINPKNAAYRGVFGFGGHQCAKALLLTQPELIIAIGTSMGEWNCSAWSETVFNNRLIHIDVSEQNLARTPMARLHVQGRILTVCQRLINLLRVAPNRVLPRPGVGAYPQHAEQPRYALDTYRSDAVPIKPQRLMRELSERCPPSTRFLADPGNSMAWALHYLEIHDRRMVQASPAIGHGVERRRSNPGWLKVAMDFCPMGWAIGAAVGVARGTPERPVVCITGDGSYLMNGQEITVAASERLCVLYVILNDSALGMVKHGQRLTGAEPIAFELPTIDFCLMAEAMGIPGHVIRAPSDLDALDFHAIFQRRGPTLLDVRIDGEEIPPMNLRIETLTSA